MRLEQYNLKTSAKKELLKSNYDEKTIEEMLSTKEKINNYFEQPLSKKGADYDMYIAKIKTDNYIFDLFILPEKHINDISDNIIRHVEIYGR